MKEHTVCRRLWPLIIAFVSWNKDIGRGDKLVELGGRSLKSYEGESSFVQGVFAGILLNWVSPRLLIRGRVGLTQIETQARFS